MLIVFNSFFPGSSLTGFLSKRLSRRGGGMVTDNLFFRAVFVIEAITAEINQSMLSCCRNSCMPPLFPDCIYGLNLSLQLNRMTCEHRVHTADSKCFHDASNYKRHTHRHQCYKKLRAIDHIGLDKKVG